MAIAAFLPGITAQILINGEPATEHDDLDDIQIEHEDSNVRAYQAERCVSKYIESVTGSDFSIRLAVAAPYSNSMPSKVRFYIKLDGKEVWVSTAARPRVKENGGRWEEEVEGVKTGKGAGCRLHRFRFAEIKTDDSSLEPAKVKRLAHRLLEVGTIVIKVYRGNYGKKGGETPGTTSGFQNENEVIPEKALKGEAKSHGTALGAEERVTRGDVWRAEKIDGEDYPQAIFRLMYRSREALKQLHVINRTPSPSPEPSRSATPESEEDGISNSLTPAQQRKAQNSIASLRRKDMRNGSNCSGSFRGGRHSRVTIKKEHVGRRKLKGGNGRVQGGMPQVVDLTGDDDQDEHEDEELFVNDWDF